MIRKRHLLKVVYPLVIKASASMILLSSLIPGLFMVYSLITSEVFKTTGGVEDLLIQVMVTMFAFFAMSAIMWMGIKGYAHVMSQACSPFRKKRLKPDEEAVETAR